ncbi:MAG: bifunctional folylpolyglutamate synthase/dihydrofolate synthase, partial [Vulcanimicrobiaceae bacterium]
MTQILTYSDAERYVLSTINEHVSRSQPYRLERMVGFLRELGDPQRRYPTIHVGGTSGKGSTCTLLASVLQAAGHRTGLHVKPHLQSMTERACIDGIDISQDDFTATLVAMMPAIERAAARGERPSYYETLLALAFRYFADQNVDIAVIEVGLGGRLDGTNVLVPLVTAITSIGYDHTEVLGDTLELIAAEKAGIAKPGVPMVANIEDDAARCVVKDACAAVGAPFRDVRSERSSPYVEQIHLDGAFQRENAKTALAVLSALPAPFTPDGQAIARGFAKTRIAGRMERISTNPITILDIAHN